MTWKQFREISEVYNNPMNLFLIVLGMGYAKFNFGVFFDFRILLFVVTLSLVYIVVNMFNNYADYLNAKDENYKSQTNIIGREGLDLKLVRHVILFFFVLSLFFGAMMVVTSDWLIGVLGIFGYLVGLGYSAGPKAINATFFAEFLPATLSGFMIPFITVHLLTFETQPITGDFLFRAILAFLPAVLSVAIGLLCNNTCDLEEDIRNGRKTLVYYLGKKRAVNLLFLLTNLVFVVIAGAAFLKITPFLTLLAVFLLPIILKLLRPYRREQVKTKTYPIVVKSITLIVLFYPILLLIGALITTSTLLQ